MHARPLVLPALLALTTFAAACSSQSPASPAAPAIVGSTADSTGATAVPRGSDSARGVVAGLAGSCPELNFTLGTIKVRTSAATVFQGGTCADVQNGRDSASHGTKQADGSLLAAGVILRATQSPRPQPPVRTPTGAVSGAVAALGGTCPAISFTIGDRRVTTSAGTKFEGKSCADIRNADRVQATGTVQPDRSVLATTVRSETPRTPGRR